MKIIPVLDVMGGVVVRGVAGRRREYRPIASKLTTSCRPVEVARAQRERFGLDELYVADLDAVGGAPPNLPLLDELRQEGFSCWVDAGIRDLHGATIVSEHAEIVIAGLETLSGPAAWSAIHEMLGRRAIFSLDLKNGVPLTGGSDWATDACGIAEQAIALGAERLILLDLGRVGMGQGTGTETLCAGLLHSHPSLQLIVGGGVRSRQDLLRLRDDGITAILVASALHDGVIAPRDLMDVAADAG